MVEFKAQKKPSAAGGTRCGPSLRWSLVFAAHAQRLLAQTVDRSHHEHRQSWPVVDILLCEANEQKRRTPRLVARLAGQTIEHGR